ncbi:MAG: DUF433 domain-containing protein [Thermodesulfobacteriota bacterium]|nr:DUF433 domain-containing protein [Thermodesulfobacteriota bacterium]
MHKNTCVRTVDQISNQELLKKTLAYIAGLLGKPEMMGKPVIKGTRITVELILEKIASGESVDQILNEHPRLTREAIQESCAFAGQYLRKSLFFKVKRTTSPGQLKRTGTPDGPTPELV